MSKRAGEQPDSGFSACTNAVTVGAPGVSSSGGADETGPADEALDAVSAEADALPVDLPLPPVPQPPEATEHASTSKAQALAAALFEGSLSWVFIQCQLLLTRITLLRGNHCDQRPHTQAEP